ncbi:phosphopantetheine-binding protein [Methylophilus sp. UBA6697]|jgi:acyl carrier protein|uniref:phosphopantetheine-binding protein n=1 Tax=Methylophilus sp. UBA6697 TaxID=1946902 RepID=UPI000EE1AB84|nr:phosphopantetheine-binding protein [Methylophilus sp. UBA6697]HCU84685.1 phosphopantetheine-binding protein [Methylophilus sp.]
MNNTFEVVSKLIANKLEIDQQSITRQSKLIELGLDSLDIFDIIFQAEDQYGIKVPNPSEEIVTVDDVVKMLDELLAAGASA